MKQEHQMHANLQYFVNFYTKYILLSDQSYPLYL